MTNPLQSFVLSLIPRKCFCFGKPLPAVVLLLLIGVSGTWQSAAGLVRVPNTTLTMPPTPPIYGYTTTDAFPDLTFQDPVCIASPPGETNRLFVLERPGRIQVITNLANPTKTLFLDISSRVNTDVDSGLLGLAFHPGYLTNRYFFVFYILTTETALGYGLHHRLARLKTSQENPNEALPDTEVALITQLSHSVMHHGGDIHFGPDGYLYVSLGDGGDADVYSQRIDQGFFSGILRVDVDLRPGSLLPNPHPAATTNYAVPPDNPFVSVTNFNGTTVNPGDVRTEFWAVGLRVPWRMSFDPLTGNLFCGDVGEDAREEVDLIIKGGNYGWNYREGTIAGPRETPEGLTFIEPLLDYQHLGTTEDPTREGNSVTGGVVYRGSRFPELYGEYVFGDFVGNIWALHVEEDAASDFRQLTALPDASAFGIHPANGDLLIANYGEARIHRLIHNENPTGSPLPPTLADTGAFSDLTTLALQPGIVPYDINVPFWSDHAEKSRWFSVPDTNLLIGFQSNGNWLFPTGSVWIKHFELELTNGLAESRRRLETRFLVRDDRNGVYGFTYRWGDSLTNAALVPGQGMNEAFEIHDGTTVRTQVWHYPARTECLICHTRQGGLALGFNTPQLNRSFNYNGHAQNQLGALHDAGFFDTPPGNHDLLPALAHATNSRFTVEHRVRSYLAANCAHCHQPGGTGRGYWDARFFTPLSEAGIVDGALINIMNDPLNRVIRPGSIERSLLLRRIANLGDVHMPPLATSELNQEAIALLTQWITNDLAQPFPKLLSIFFDSSAHAHLRFTAAKSRTYDIETSSDLSHWHRIATVETDAEGLAEYQEPAVATGPGSFYRIALQ